MNRTNPEIRQETIEAFKKGNLDAWLEPSVPAPKMTISGTDHKVASIPEPPILKKPFNHSLSRGFKKAPKVKLKKMKNTRYELLKTEYNIIKNRNR